MSNDVNSVENLSPQQLVHELRDLLGPRIVAAIAGVKQARTIHDWADGNAAMENEVLPRLRLSLEVSRSIIRVEELAVLHAWIQGMNPQLDDRSPAGVLKDGDLETEGPRVLATARAFAFEGEGVQTHFEPMPPPRDPRRIPILLDLFRQHWERHPDQRFFQLISNFKREMGVDGDGYQVEDDELTEEFKGSSVDDVESGPLVSRLVGALGKTLVAALAGTMDRDAPEQWAAGSGAPDAAQLARLETARAVWEAVSAAEGDDVARQWFIGANPWLGEDSPVDAIREDRFEEVMGAAVAMTEDRFSG